MPRTGSRLRKKTSTPDSPRDVATSPTSDAVCLSSSQRDALGWPKERICGFALQEGDQLHQLHEQVHVRDGLKPPDVVEPSKLVGEQSHLVQCDCVCGLLQLMMQLRRQSRALVEASPASAPTRPSGGLPLPSAPPALDTASLAAPPPPLVAARRPTRRPPAPPRGSDARGGSERKPPAPPPRPPPG